MRETGYYWCLLEDEWGIFFYNKTYEMFMGMSVEFEESDFQEIDEKQITR